MDRSEQEYWSAEFTDDFLDRQADTGNNLLSKNKWKVLDDEVAAWRALADELRRDSP
jgi:hypothetical protein